MQDENLTEVIIGAAIEVHRHLGPGLLESAYRRCLVHELRLRDVPVASEVSLDLEYKGRVGPDPVPGTAPFRHLATRHA